MVMVMMLTMVTAMMMTMDNGDGSDGIYDNGDGDCYG